MKKVMILITAMAMATFTAQANDIKPEAIIVAMDTEAPAPTQDEANTTEEAPKGN